MWGIVEGTKILRESKITAGKIQTGGGCLPNHQSLIMCWYYPGRKFAIIEAKSDQFEVVEGVSQAQVKIFRGLDNKQKEFLEFILNAEEILVGVDNIRATFIEFQKYLREEVAG